MTASQLAPICRHVALWLVLVGLLLAEFLGLKAIGMVLALLGIAAGGAAMAAGYLHWETGE